MKGMRMQKTTAQIISNKCHGAVGIGVKITAMSSSLYEEDFKECLDDGMEVFRPPLRNVDLFALAAKEGRPYALAAGGMFIGWLLGATSLLSTALILWA